MLLSGAILAGGKSSRMGTDKANLPVGNQTYLARLMEEFSSLDELLISVNHPRGLDHEVKDVYPGIGPIGGIYSCLSACRHDYLFICAADMPLLKKELLDFMATYISQDFNAYVIKAAKTHPLCGIYHKSALPVILAQIEAGNYRLMDLLKSLRTKTISLEHTQFSPSMLSNINTPQDVSKMGGPCVFSISGLKNTGKTTLMTKLIAGLKTKNYRVGVVKHDGHEFEMDRAGTDSYRHRQSGADLVSVYSKTQFAVLGSWDEADLSKLFAYFKDVDIILVEGLKRGPYPKIEVVNQESVCEEATLLAIASDSGFTHPRIPVYGRDEADKFIDLLIERVEANAGLLRPSN